MFFSFRCYVNIRCCKWNSPYFFSSVLCRCCWRANAWNSHNDSNSTIHSNSSCSSYFTGKEASATFVDDFVAPLSLSVINNLRSRFSYRCCISSSVIFMHWLIMLDLLRGWVLEYQFYACHGNLLINIQILNINLLICDISSFRLRYTQPDLVRPIRVNLFWPILYLLATVFVTVVPMYASPYETGYGCLMILTSVPVYFIFIAWKNKPKAVQQAMGEYHMIENYFLWSVIKCLKKIIGNIDKKFYCGYFVHFMHFSWSFCVKIKSSKCSFGFFVHYLKCCHPKVSKQQQSSVLTC